MDDTGIDHTAGGHTGVERRTPCYSRDELITELGLTADYAEKIWNAFGFARAHTEDKVFTQADVDALRIFSSAEFTMPLTAQLATARAIGQTMSRLADWQADQLRALDANPDVPWTIEQMTGAFRQVQGLIWRRHLALALERGALEDEHGAAQTENREKANGHRDGADKVVGFADIVGYTSLSRRIEITELETLIENFEESTHQVVVSAGGTVIKTLGDAVMFLFDTADQAAVAALGIHALVDAELIPEVRVGLARGHVLSRLGDVFGEPVNIASRLCSSARPGTTLVDEAVADALDGDDRYYVRSIPTLSVRGYRRLKAKSLAHNRNNKSGK